MPPNPTDVSDEALAALMLIFEDTPLPILKRHLVTAKGVVGIAVDTLLRAVNEGPSHISPISSTKHAKRPFVPPPPPQSDPTPAASVFDVLKWSEEEAAKKKARVIYPPMLNLVRPEDVAAKSPCTLIHSILPADLADRLLTVMMAESRTWKPYVFWLFDREVTSPHQSSFYSSLDPVYHKNHTYNGKRMPPPNPYLPEMAEAARIIEEKAQEVLAGRERLPYEHPGPWKANVALGNVYASSAQSVGWHSDRLNSLGPQPTIASISLGACRPFRLKRRPALDDTPQPTLSIDLPHNSLLIMHANCQEEYTHHVPPHRVGMHQISGPLRINITFRMYREYWGPATVPRCECNIPAVLKSVVKRSEGFGKYFYFCDQRASAGDGCSFFQWVDPYRDPTLKKKTP